MGEHLNELYALLLFLSENPQAGILSLSDPEKYAEEKRQAKDRAAAALEAASASPADRRLLNDIINQIAANIGAIDLANDIRTLDQDDPEYDAKAGRIRETAAELAMGFMGQNSNAILETVMSANSFFPADIIVPDQEQTGAFADFGRGPGLNNAHVMLFMMAEGRTLDEVLSSGVDERNQAARRFVQMLDAHKNDTPQEKASFYGELYHRMGDALMNYRMPQIDWTNPLAVLSVQSEMAALRNMAASWKQSRRELYGYPEFYDHYDIESFIRQQDAIRGLGSIADAAYRLFTADAANRAGNRYIVEQYGTRAAGRTAGEFPESIQGRGEYLESLSAYLIQEANRAVRGTEPELVDDYLNFRNDHLDFQPALAQAEISWAGRSSMFSPEFLTRVADRRRHLKRMEEELTWTAEEARRRVREETSASMQARISRLSNVLETLVLNNADKYLPISEDSLNKAHERKLREAIRDVLNGNGPITAFVPAIENAQMRGEEMRYQQERERLDVLQTAVPREFDGTYRQLTAYLWDSNGRIARLKELDEFIKKPGMIQMLRTVRPNSNAYNLDERVALELDRDQQVRDDLLKLMRYMWGEESQESIDQMFANAGEMERLRHYLSLEGIDMDQVLDMVRQTRILQAGKNPMDSVREIAMNIQAADFSCVEPYLTSPVVAGGRRGAVSESEAEDGAFGPRILTDAQIRFATENFDRVFDQVFPQAERNKMLDEGRDLFDHIYVDGQSMNDRFEALYADLPYSEACRNMKCDLMRLMMTRARVDVMIPGSDGERLLHMRAFSGYQAVNDVLFEPRRRASAVKESIQASIRESRDNLNRRLSAPGEIRRRQDRIGFEQGSPLTTNGLSVLIREMPAVTELELPTGNMTSHDYNAGGRGRTVASMFTWAYIDPTSLLTNCSRFQGEPSNETLVAEHMFDGMVEQLKSAGRLMDDRTMRNLGIAGPIQLFYVDGMPAWDYLVQFANNRNLAGQAMDLNNPEHVQILKGEIMAAMVSGKHHVEAVWTERDPLTGEMIPHASEMRMDFSLLNEYVVANLNGEILPHIMELQQELFAGETDEQRRTRQADICGRFRNEYITNPRRLITPGNADLRIYEELGNLDGVRGRLMRGGAILLSANQQQILDGARLFGTIHRNLGVRAEESADMIDTGIMKSAADMYYIDGVPARDYVRSRSEYADLDENSSIFENVLRSEIVAAAASGRHHVDVARVGLDETGAYRTEVVDVTLDLAGIPALDRRAQQLRLNDSEHDARHDAIRDDLNARLARVVVRKLEDAKNPYTAAVDRFNISRRGNFEDYFGCNSPNELPAGARTMHGYGREELEQGMLTLAGMYLMGSNPQVRLADLTDSSKYRGAKQAAGQTLAVALAAGNGSPADRSMIRDMMEDVTRQIAELDLKKEIAYALGVDLNRKPPYSQREFLELMEDTQNAPKVSAMLAALSEMAVQVERMELQAYGEMRERLGEQTYADYHKNLSMLRGLGIEKDWIDGARKHRMGQMVDELSVAAAHMITAPVREWIAVEGRLSRIPDDLARNMTNAAYRQRVRNNLENLKAEGIPGISVDSLLYDRLNPRIKEALPVYASSFTERDFYGKLKGVEDSQAKQVNPGLGQITSQEAQDARNTYYQMYKSGPGFIRASAQNQAAWEQQRDLGVSAYEQIVEALEPNLEDNDFLKQIGADGAHLESMFYIDGIPAVEYTRQVAPASIQMNRWQTNEDARAFLRSVIASAAWSPEHHVDLVQVGLGKRGEMKIGAAEVRPDIHVLDGMEKWYETRPSKAADRSYQGANMADRHQRICADYSLKIASPFMNAHARWNEMEKFAVRYENKSEQLNAQYFSSGDMTLFSGPIEEILPGIAANGFHGARIHAQLLFLAMNPDAGIADLTDPYKFVEEKAQAGRMLTAVLMDPLGNPPEVPSYQDVLDRIGEKLASMNVKEELDKVAAPDDPNRKGLEGALKSLEADLITSYYKIHKQEILEPVEGEKRYFKQGRIDLAKRPDIHDFGRSPGANNAHAMLMMLMDGMSLEQILTESTLEQRQKAADRFLDMLSEHQDEPMEDRARFYGEFFKKAGDAIMNIRIPDIDWMDPAQLLAVQPMFSALSLLSVIYTQGREPIYRNGAFYDNYELSDYSQAANYVVGVGAFAQAVSQVFDENAVCIQAVVKHMVETYGPKFSGKTIKEAFDAEFKDTTMQMFFVENQARTTAGLNPQMNPQMEDYVNYRVSTPFNQQALLDQSEPQWNRQTDLLPEKERDDILRRVELIRRQKAEEQPKPEVRPHAEEQPRPEVRPEETQPEATDTETRRHTTLAKLLEKEERAPKQQKPVIRQRSNSLQPQHKVLEPEKKNLTPRNPGGA